MNELQKITAVVDSSFLIGIAGFLLLAKNRRLITEVRPYLLQLQLKGFRLSRKLINEILSSTGENPM